jgi:hypothetical protein
MDFTMPIARRFFMGIVGLPFLRSLIFPYFVVLLLLTAADAHTDWTALRVQIQAMPPGSRTATLTVLAGGWSLIAGHALRRVWRQRSVRLLARLPIGSGAWLFYALPALSLALIPLLGVCWLASANIASGVGVLATSLIIVFGASLEVWVGAALLCIGFALVFVTLFATSYGPLAGCAGLLASAVIMQPCVRLMRACVVMTRERKTGTLVSGHVIALLIRLDALALYRVNRRAVANLLMVTACSVAMMAAFRINGKLAGGNALAAAVVLFAVAISPIYSALENVRNTLGKNVLRKRWPITTARRSLATCAFTALLALPATLLMALAGSTMGTLNLLIFLAFVCTEILLIAGQFAARLRDPASAVGAFLNVLGVHVVIILVTPTIVYLTLAFCAGALSWVRLGAGLKRFAIENPEG